MTIQPQQKCVIYARVSSPKQVTQGHGLSSQETRCREYAGYKNWEVAEVFYDDITGAVVSRRGMDALLVFLKKHKREKMIVIIDDISRLGRERRAYWPLRDSIIALGSSLASPSITFGTDADSDFHEGLMVEVAQHQRGKNAEQTRNRMRARAMGGYWVAKAPIGYRMENRTGHGKFLVRNEPFATIVADAFNGYASGRFETIVEVKRFLEAQPAWPKDKRGEVHQERINELFARPVYAAHITHEQWGLHLIPAKHEPLVSLETWQSVQNRHKDMAKAPVRKDFREDFPLRGFVLCADCGQALTSCWSKGRSSSYAYYLCDTRGCPLSRKSIPREEIEGDFEKLLTNLRPSEGLFNLALKMLRDVWGRKANGAREQSAALQKEIAATSRKVDQLLERIVEASSDSVVVAYERKIKELETQKAIMTEQMATIGKPIRSFGETYRTAFDFLGNPSKLWHSPRIEDRRAVLKLVFAERLPYVRGHGYRTAKISTPFKMLGDMNMSEKEMVPRTGIEPVTRGFSIRCSTN